MSKIKVLVVDDAVVIRKIVADALSQDKDLEVVGVAANGKIALEKIESLNPEILTLDVEMPVMDGLETLEQLKKFKSKPKVIMFSTLTQRGGSATLEALARGAMDYVTKPSNVANLLAAVEHIKKELIPKIKGLCPRKPIKNIPATPKDIPATASPSPRFPIRQDVVTLAEPPAVQAKINIVTIGVSTGGPNALTDLLPHFPEDFPVPIVIVQHMPAQFTQLLAERLNNKSSLEVLENQPGLELIRGRVIIAAGDYHMTLHRQGNQVFTGANQGPPENSCRPAVDVLFRSVASMYGTNALALILTGMGQDGLKGCEVIRSAKGRVIVQDEATSVVWGMPGFVARSGLAEKILPLSEVAPEVIRLCQHKRTAATHS
ncbi:MAG: chemotaxis response regulator protein-glutamate methylesterase [Nitrospinaceae bacterium]